MVIIMKVIRGGVTRGRDIPRVLPVNVIRRNIPCKMIKCMYTCVHMKTIEKSRKFWKGMQVT